MLFVPRFVSSAIVLVLVATYYLLASIPYSYYHFIQDPQLSWLPWFILVHPLLFMAATAAVVPRTRTLPASLQPYGRYVTVAGGALAVCMGVIERVPVLQSDQVSAAISFGPLLLLIAAAALHVAAADSRSPTSTRAVVPPIWQAAIAGLIVGSAYVAASTERGAATTLGVHEFSAAAIVSILGHAICFGAAGAVLAAACAVARRLRYRWLTESLTIAACLAALVAVIVRRSLLTALILSDIRASLVAGTVAVALVATAWAVRVHRGPATKIAGRGWRVGALLLVLVVLVALLPPMLLLVDWGGSLQKMIALAAWGTTIGLLTAIRSGIGRRTIAVGCAVLVAVTSAVSVAARTSTAQSTGSAAAADLQLAIDRYATFDPSLTVLLDVFRPMASDNDFLTTVQSLGDATDDKTLNAVPMSFADVAAPRTTRAPNIFVIVVDSLRPDYLGAYNPAATFTPAITRFARDNIVMRRAFTQYAGTALSQPAIWAGGLIQRAMYVKPFAAVNNLERLSVAAGYRRYISIDPPLGAILEDWTRLSRLDADLTDPDRRDQMFKFDLCRTVPDLLHQIDRDGTDRPIFMYSQPQNLHIRTLAGDSAPRDERVTVGGVAFFKPAVAALTRLDACFGQFVDGLKSRGLYDDSIVVLTADHGDSYGEAGRWAHAFYMAPETLRVPLILHVPAKYLESRTWDRDEVALLSDVTPTLFDLVGYPPSSDVGGIAGRSLFTRAAELRPARDVVLVQSSYSRLYGLLGGNARWLYVADTTHYREEFYDLTVADPFPRPVAASDRPKYRQWIVEQLKRLDSFYTRGRY